MSTFTSSDNPLTGQEHSLLSFTSFPFTYDEREQMHLFTSFFAKKQGSSIYNNLTNCSITNEEDLLDEYKEFVSLNFEYLRKTFLEKHNNLPFEPLIKIQGYFSSVQEAIRYNAKLEKEHGEKCYTICPNTGAWVPLTINNAVFNDQELVNSTINSILGQRMSYEMGKENTQVKSREVILEEAKRSGLIEREKDEIKIIDGKKMRKKKTQTVYEKMSDAELHAVHDKYKNEKLAEKIIERTPSEMKKKIQDVEKNIKFLRVQLSGEEPPPMTLSGLTLQPMIEAEKEDEYEEIVDDESAVPS